MALHPWSFIFLLKKRLKALLHFDCFYNFFFVPAPHRCFCMSCCTDHGLIISFSSSFTLIWEYSFHCQWIHHVIMPDTWLFLVEWSSLNFPISSKFYATVPIIKIIAWKMCLSSELSYFVGSESALVIFSLWIILQFIFNSALCIEEDVYYFLLSRSRFLPKKQAVCSKLLFINGSLSLNAYNAVSLFII
jgi:hypothetical protein